MLELRVEKHKKSPMETFRLGIYLGISLPLLYGILHIIVEHPWLDFIPGM